MAGTLGRSDRAFLQLLRGIVVIIDIRNKVMRNISFFPNHSSQPSSPSEGGAGEGLWLSLVDRYFDGETTDEEERLLRQFLVSDEAKDKRFDAVKAVMGLLVVGKRKHQRRIVGTQRRRENWLIVGQVAAFLAFVFLVGRPFFNAPAPDYVMFSQGQRITDETLVMNEMEQTMAEVFSPTATPDVDAQLNEIFQNP